MAKIKVSEVIFREDLYPRIKHDSALVMKYTENLECLPPIEVNQNYELIDGFHRWTAHKQAEIDEIEVIITETKTELEFLILAITRNANHGQQMSNEDKKDMAIRLYQGGIGLSKEEIAKHLSVTVQMVRKYLSETDKQLAEKQEKQVFGMYMQGYKQDEIAEKLNVSRQLITKIIKKLTELNDKDNVKASFHEEDFERPIYNVWAFSKCSNAVDHFGKSEQRIVDRLLYLYTEPFDLVFDPFAGGGSTIDVCTKRFRRCYVSDLNPKPARANEIRKHDIGQGLPEFNNMWSDIKLTYLDPPYWKQAEGQYSKDAEDFANMPIEEFYEKLAGLVNSIGRKQKQGVIALIIQPTQWKTEDKHVEDHVMELIKRVKLPVKTRISAPYSSQQCNAQQVNWAKDNKELLVLTREVIIWKCEK